MQRPVITLSDVVQHWNALGLDKQRLQDLLELMSLGSPETPSDAVLDWNKLLALAAGQLGDVNNNFLSPPLFSLTFGERF